MLIVKKKLPSVGLKVSWYVDKFYELKSLRCLLICLCESWFGYVCTLLLIKSGKIVQIGTVSKRSDVHVYG